MSGGVVGIDPSLTSTGLASWSPAQGWDCGRIITAGKNTDTYADTERRLDRILTGVVQYVHNEAPQLVVIEHPVRRAMDGHAADRAGLFWMIARTLTREWPTVAVAYCDNRERTRYATGKKAASKDVVLAAAIRRYVDAPIRNNDEADAVLLTAMGCRWVAEQGQELYAGVDAPAQLCREAIRHVEWPAQLGGR